MGHIPCKMKITYPSQEITRIAYLLQHEIYNTWALYFFLEIAHVVLIRCAKYIFQTKYTNHYMEKKILLLLLL